MSSKQHLLAKQLLSIIKTSLKEGEVLTYSGAALKLGKSENHARAIAQVCDLLDAAAAISEIPLLALVAVRSSNGDINPKAWKTGAPAGTREAIIQNSLSHEFSKNDFELINESLDSLIGFGNKKAWEEVKKIIPTDALLEQLSGKKSLKSVKLLLQDVLTNYSKTKLTLNGRAKNIESKDQKSLTLYLPNFFKAILESAGKKDAFKVEGSFGSGVMADVPWVGIFNKNITTSAQNGFYIVLLFSVDMKSCYLSLNQGVTTFENTYGQRKAKQKMQQSSFIASRYLNQNTTSIMGPIKLEAKGHLGKGYEIGAIHSYRYDLNNLPNNELLKGNFLNLLVDYDQLSKIAGSSLEVLAPISEEEFQQIALEKATQDKLLEEKTGGIPIPDRKESAKLGGYLRNPLISGLALRQANFKCEIDPNHKTFVSKAKNLPFVEAHHLIPMSMQKDFIYSIDVVPNVVALCPICHKLIHYGKTADKIKHIRSLFSARKDRLEKNEIYIDENKLLQYYKSNLTEDEFDILKV